MTSKFKIKLKVTGFELEVEGSREDVPLMAQAVGQQMSGLLIPASNIVEGQVVETTNSSSVTPNSSSRSSRKRSGRSPKQSSSIAKSKNSLQDKDIDWVHDPSKWGIPKQEWNTADKAIWLLYVAYKEKEVLEISASLIADTFNRGFRQAGFIRANNTSRDLGKAKGKTPAWVGENTTQKPTTWFLTQEGIKYAEILVAQALGHITTT